MTSFQFCLLAVLIVVAPHAPTAFAQWVAFALLGLAIGIAVVSLFPRKPFPPRRRRASDLPHPPPRKP